MTSEAEGGARDSGVATLSVVIPVHNEEASIAAVVDEVLAAIPAAEVIIVDDGSDDATWSAIVAVVERAPRVRAIRLRRRSGKSAALRVGVDAARAPLIATLDGDGQDVPAELPHLMSAIAARQPAGTGSLDVVGGRRAARADTWRKRAASAIFNVAVSFVTGVRMRDHNTGLKLARAEVFREIPLHGDLHRFIYVLARHHGFRVAEIDVAHRPRRAGRTKYGALRAITSLADLLLVRAHVAMDGRGPQRLALAGLASLTLGLVALAYLALTWLGDRAGAVADYVPLMDRPLILYGVLAVVVGANCISLAYMSGMVSSRDVRAPPVAERFVHDPQHGPQPVGAVLAAGSKAEAHEPRADAHGLGPGPWNTH